MMSCERPWRQAVGSLSIIFNVTMRAMRPDRLDPSRCPARVWALIERCWAQEPQQRPSAEEVASELEALLEAHCSGAGAALD